jgi:isoamylase
VVYEAHVGALTARHPMVSPERRGRYLGLADPAVIDHLLRLGVTAVELLPVQEFTSEPELVATGRRNVWGYNPLAWGAPHQGYATPGGDPVIELRSAVAALHEAGIEVWLDVVFNHTCERSLGSGPILSWRGFDNLAAYRLLPGDGGLVDEDVTGCGNTIDTRSPWMRRLIRQCLVRWVEEVGIDGFRFDLAAALVREGDGPTPDHPMVADLAAEPALEGVRLVAEPWDTGLGGYAAGRFPAPWREWNDRFREDVRGTWRAEPGGWSAFAERLTGSADLYRRAESGAAPGGSEEEGGAGPAGDGSLVAEHASRRPGARDATAGVNAVATHDGFTLADLVTWARPVGGGHDQRSSNGGIEGPTHDPSVRRVRRQRQRAMLATVLWAQGIPMIHAGDELGASKGGVADGYTLEPTAWGLPWEGADWDLVAWVAAATHLRRCHPVLRRPTWVGPDDHAVRWLTTSGEPCTDDDWHRGRTPGLQVVLVPDDPAEATALVLVAPREATAFQLPAGEWWCHLDAAQRRPDPTSRRIGAHHLRVEAPGMVLLLDQP